MTVEAPHKSLQKPVYAIDAAVAWSTRKQIRWRQAAADVSDVTELRRANHAVRPASNCVIG